MDRIGRAANDPYGGRVWSSRAVSLSPYRVRRKIRLCHRFQAWVEAHEVVYLSGMSSLGQAPYKVRSHPLRRNGIGMLHRYVGEIREQLRRPNDKKRYVGMLNRCRLCKSFKRISARCEGRLFAPDWSIDRRLAPTGCRLKANMTLNPAIDLVNRSSVHEQLSPHFCEEQMADPSACGMFQKVIHRAARKSVPVSNETVVEERAVHAQASRDGNGKAFLRPPCEMIRQVSCQETSA